MSSANASQEDVVIRAHKIAKYFPGVQALKGLEFEVKRGEVHALVGENGAGKSTLMKIIIREYQQDEGDVFIEDRNVSNMDIRDVQRLGLSLIHQDLNLIPMLTVAHNICLGQEPVTRVGTIDWKGMKRKAKGFLNEISSDIPIDATVEELSVSEQQLVAIARALATKPRFLILDEPTARLDQNASESLFSFLDKARARGLTVVYISHRLEEIYRICDRITVLRDGKKIATANVKDLPQAELVKHMVGREIKQQVPKEAVPIKDVILSVKNFTPATRARDINFDVRAGEILGIVGSIGSGKSEVARAIFGADPKKAGTISISGREAEITNPIESIARGIALIPEERKAQGLVGSESIRKNITMACLDREFCAGRFWIRQEKERRAVRNSIQKLKIATPSTEQTVELLSGGTQQKVVVGKWLLSESRIFLFDEPTKGIDVGGKHEIYRLIVDLARQGAAIVFISNELIEVLSLCDRILVMYHGAIVRELDASATDRKELLFYVMGGKDYEHQKKRN